MKTEPVRSPLLEPLKPQGHKEAQPGFKEALLDSINKVNELQLKAHTAMEELATGKSSNLHETMIAIQKAEVSFKMMMQVRNKIMNAYQEIMRMSV
ncbi:MAG: flagellar hook-basal body complex protein FliE [Thermodesulfobacteriota bacterium]